MASTNIVNQNEDSISYNVNRNSYICLFKMKLKGNIPRLTLSWRIHEEKDNSRGLPELRYFTKKN